MLDQETWGTLYPVFWKLVKLATARRTGLHRSRVVALCSGLAHTTVRTFVDGLGSTGWTTSSRRIHALVGWNGVARHSGSIVQRVVTVRTCSRKQASKELGLLRVQYRAHQRVAGPFCEQIHQAEP